jgi:hypothetical protein
VLVDQKIVDDLTGKIDALEKKIGTLDTIAKAAPLLADAITKLAAERPPEAELPLRQGPDLARATPRLVDAANDLLRGAALTADALVERGAAITAMTAAVRALAEYDLALAHYWQLAGTLEGGLPAAADQQEVAGLKSRLEGLRHGLWDAGSPKVVDSEAEAFDTIRAKIDELWPRLPDPPPLRHVLTRAVLPPIVIEGLTLDPLYARALGTRRFARPQAVGGAYMLDEVDLDLAAELAARPPPAPAPAAGAPAAAAPPPPPPPRQPAPARAPLSEAEASHAIAAARRTQWVVLVVAFAVAVITALSTLYVGNAWGTPWDYLFAGAWGLITQGVLTAIAGAIGGLGALAAVRLGLGAPRL